MPVVVLQSADRRNLFCYCDGCGCAFRSPTDAQFETGLNEVLEPLRLAPDGVACPSKERLDGTGWEHAVIEVCEDDCDMAVELDNGIKERRASGGGSAL
jgi:hypothetical protein